MNGKWIDVDGEGDVRGGAIVPTTSFDSAIGDDTKSEITDGRSVGDRVAVFGTCVNEIVAGRRVGVFDGDSFEVVGFLVGALDGWLIGCLVASRGAKEGGCLGKVDGKVVGVELGLSLGCLVGEEEIAMVGVPVGNLKIGFGPVDFDVGSLT